MITLHSKSRPLSTLQIALALAYASTIVIFPVVVRAADLTSVPTTWSTGDLTNTSRHDYTTTNNNSTATINVNGGTVGTFTNTLNGNITSTDVVIRVQSGSVSGIHNLGLLSGVMEAFVIQAGTVTTITNSGTMLGTMGDTFQMNGGTVGTLNNSGTISSTEIGSQTDVGVAIYSGALTELNNSGTISAIGTNGWGAAIFSMGSSGSTPLTSLNNQVGGVISSVNWYGIENYSATIGSIVNAGTIKSDVTNAINNASGATITAINNTGDIYSVNPLAYSINNAGAIGTINNLQGVGGTSGALTLSGNLPTTYNIILGSSAGTYGVLSYTGSSSSLANFGIHSGSIKANTYAGVLNGVTAVNAGATGTYSGQSYVLQLQSGSTSIWDLLFPNWVAPVIGPNAANTLSSVELNASGLSSIYNQQAAAYNIALSYDCSVYDKNNLCISAGGRYTNAKSPLASEQAGLVVVGYRPSKSFRFGGFLDQSGSRSNPSGFSQSKNSPMWGLFARWNKNTDGTGLNVQASAVSSSSTLNVTRSQLANTEAGTGSTAFDGQAYQLTLNYLQPVSNVTTVVPYVGLRYSRINAGAYTENTSADVTAPLSYNAMAQKSLSAIAGLGVSSHLTDKLKASASVGVQQDMSHKMDNYQGTSSISGLETFSVQMPGRVKTMATVTAGLAYDVSKRERLSLNVQWQEQPFAGTHSTTGLVTYSIGF